MVAEQAQEVVSEPKGGRHAQLVDEPKWKSASQHPAPTHPTAKPDRQDIHQSLGIHRHVGAQPECQGIHKRLGIQVPVDAKPDGQDIHL